MLQPNTSYTIEQLKDLLNTDTITQFNLKDYKSKIQAELKDWEKDSLKYLIYATLYFLLPDNQVAIVRSVKDFFKDCIFETWQRFRNMWKYKVFIPNHFGYSTCDVLIKKAIPMLILHREQYVKDKYSGIPTWLDKLELENKGLFEIDKLEIENYLDNSQLDISDRQVEHLTKIWISILDEIIKGLQSEDISILFEAEKKFWKYGGNLWI